MCAFTYVTLRERPEIMKTAAQWYLCLDEDRIIGGTI